MKIRILLICFIALGVQLFAQSGADVNKSSYTLEECISLALEHNIDIRNAMGQVTLSEMHSSNV